MDDLDDEYSSCRNYQNNNDKWAKYIKFEYDKIVKNFTIKKAKDIRY